MSLKQRVFREMSPYIRLRDALEFCRSHKIDISQFNDWHDLPVACCCCGDITTVRHVDAGHFLGRGIGGGSGAYLDERNVHAQINTHNAFKDAAHGYEEFMIKKYGQDVIDDLRRLDKTRKYTKLEIEGLRLFYKVEFKKLKESIS